MLSINTIMSRTAKADHQRVIKLNMIDVIQEMVDHTLVPMWAFEDSVQGPNIPGPLIFAEEGERLDIYVENQLDEDHAFTIPGVIDSDVIKPGRGKRLKFRVLVEEETI